MRSTPVLLVLALVSPGAGASSAFTAELAFGDRPVLAGDVRVSTSFGALDLLPAVRAQEPFAIAWESARGYRITTEWSHLAPSSGVPLALGLGPTNESISYGAATLDRITCGQPHCEVVLVTLDDRTLLSLEGRARGPLAWTSAEVEHWAEFSDPGHDDAFHLAFPPGTFSATAGPSAPGAWRIEQGAYGSEGPVGLLLVGIAGRLTRGEGTERLALASDELVVDGPLGLRALRHTRASFVFLELEGARLDHASAITGVLRAPAPTIHVEGRLVSADATGVLRVDGRTLPLDRTPLDVAGALALAPRATHDSPLLPLGGDGIRARATITGEARTLQIGGEPIATSPTPAAIAIGAFALLCALALVPFYTRLDSRRVAENPNRKRILEAVGASPGILTADLARGLSLARVVVQHHLRILERHRLVTSRATSKSRHYFLAGSAPAGSTMLVHVALRDPKTRLLASLLAGAAAPLSQRDLGTLAGAPQRTISHHVARLEEAGALEVHGSHPRRYAPSAALSACLPAGAQEPAAPPPAR